MSSRKLPPEGNDTSIYNDINPSQSQDTFSPSPTIDILQNSPTMTPALTPSSNRLPSSPLHRLVENDISSPTFPSNKETFESSLPTSIMKQQNAQQIESSPISPSDLNLQSQQHIQINSGDILSNGLSRSSSSFNADMGNQLNLLNGRPNPPAHPASSSSAYPYFTSPNVDLSAQYYGSYSNNDGVFSSKTLQPSRSRNMKSRSHTGKTEYLFFPTWLW